MSTLNPHLFFYKTRTVPFALRDKVEADLDRLLKEDIIEPMRISDWAAPIVPVPKGIIPSEFMVTARSLSTVLLNWRGILYLISRIFSLR